MAGGIDMALAGKTGTTQNTSSGWAVGYSPYITTAVWFGFDRPGKSLGATQSGGLLPAPLWARFMKFYHRDLPRREFTRPEGIINVTIQKETGLLPEGNPQESLITEVFIEGTEPKERSRYFNEMDSFYNSRLESLFVDSNTRQAERALGDLSLKLPPDLRSNAPNNNAVFSQPASNNSLGEYGLKLPPSLFSPPAPTNTPAGQEDSLFILQGSNLEEEAAQDTLFRRPEVNSVSRPVTIPIEQEYTLDEGDVNNSNLIN
jgi:membrane peptidoglycan carboxypeptidase